jgi:hypothetical protein
MPQQLSLNFEGGLTARFRSLREVVQSAVLTSNLGVTGVAGKMDMGHSELSRRLDAGAADNRPLRVDDLVAIIEHTGDHRPIYWLVEHFLQSPEIKRTMAIDQLAGLMPQIAELVRQAGATPPPQRGRR